MHHSIATQVMLYMSAQNELADKAQENIDAIESCVDLEKLCVYIMLDTVENDDVENAASRNTVQYVLPPHATKADFEKKKQELNRNKDVTDPRVFSRILDSASSHFNSFLAPEPPQQKVLIFWGHGGGMVMLDEAQQSGVDRARANMKEFADILVRKGERPLPLSFDIVAFDSCYMCMIETMHQLRQGAQYVLCSSTMVDADGFPYEVIFQELKANGDTLEPRTAAARIAELYNQHYLKRFKNGNRFLFVCDTRRTDRCVHALNSLGETLSSLMSAAEADDPVRVAISEALIGAGVDSSYVYVFAFLKMLSLTLKKRIADAELAVVIEKSDQLRDSVRQAFDGNLGDSSKHPVSPLIWAPFQINSFLANEVAYNDLDASEKGQAGWATLWRTFHRRSASPPVATVSRRYRREIGLPTTKQLAL